MSFRGTTSFCPPPKESEPRCGITGAGSKGPSRMRLILLRSIGWQLSPPKLGFGGQRQLPARMPQRSLSRRLRTHRISSGATFSPEQRRLPPSRLAFRLSQRAYSSPSKLFFNINAQCVGANLVLHYYKGYQETGRGANGLVTTHKLTHPQTQFPPTDFGLLPVERSSPTGRGMFAHRPVGSLPRQMRLPAPHPGSTGRTEGVQ